MQQRLFAAARPVGGRRGAMRDALAGVTLASMNVPQLLGYARIAGMPLISGLYTALLVPVAFAMFGSSRHLVVAADSGTAAILAGALSHMAVPGSAHYLSLAATTALLAAGMLLVARIFKLGFLADFLSRTVLVGFLAGVGVQVAVAMLADMGGITINARNTILQVWQIARELPHPDTVGARCRGNPRRPADRTEDPRVSRPRRGADRGQSRLESCRARIGDDRSRSGR